MAACAAEVYTWTAVSLHLGRIGFTLFHGEIYASAVGAFRTLGGSRVGHDRRLAWKLGCRTATRSGGVGSREGVETRRKKRMVAQRRGGAGGLRRWRFLCVRETLVSGAARTKAADAAGQQPRPNPSAPQRLSASARPFLLPALRLRANYSPMASREGYDRSGADMPLKRLGRSVPRKADQRRNGDAIRPERVGAAQIGQVDRERGLFNGRASLA